jgi:hypothetical protein
VVCLMGTESIYAKSVGESNKAGDGCQVSVNPVSGIRHLTPVTYRLLFTLCY